jgi:ASPIC and UnbV
LEQTIGLAKSQLIALLEIHWPSSGTTQIFRDIAADQALEITDFAGDYHPLERKSIPVPD